MKSASLVTLTAQLFTVFCMVSLCLSALIPAWAYHLSTDLNSAYLPRAEYFLTHGSLQGLAFNKYQPGAVIFFILLTPSFLIEHSQEMYQTGLFAANILLGLIISRQLAKVAGAAATFLFWGISLAIGPIVFYRFEYWVMLWVVMAILFWRQKKFSLAMGSLAFASITKVFPVLFLPYFCWLAWKGAGWKMALQVFLQYTVSLLTFLLMYMLIFRVTPTQLLDNLSPHENKPVHIESLWGNILTISTKLRTDQYPRAVGLLGIVGIDPQETPLNLSFYNRFWILPVGLLYFWQVILRKTTSRTSEVDIRFLVSLVLVFLVTSKTLTPQYLLWGLLLLPFLSWPRTERAQKDWILITFMALSICALTQYIYPISYNDLIGTFYATGQKEYLFWTLCLRNVLVIALAWKLLVPQKGLELRQRQSV